MAALFRRSLRLTAVVAPSRRLQWSTPNRLRVLSSTASGVQHGPSCSEKEDAVLIDWKSQNAWSRFHYLWLRDNCMCPQCFHSATNQRLVDTLAIPPNITPSSVELEGENLCIRWPDSHVSKYPVKWLVENSYESSGLDQVSARGDSEPELELWGKEIASSPPQVEYARVMEDDRELLKWLTIVEKYGFSFVCGTPPNEESTRKLMERAGIIRNTFYGSLYTITSDLSVSDTAYTPLAIDLHTDNNYFAEATALQCMHCILYEATGGESILVDGFKLAEEIRKKNPEHFRILSTVPIPYHHTCKVHSFRNSNVTFITDPKTDRVTRVHFNNIDRAPLDAACVESLQQLGGESGPVSILKLYEAMQTFIKVMSDESFQYRFYLEPGKPLTFNNHRLLHARTAFTGKRTLCGCVLNEEEWSSKMRVLRGRYGCV